MAKLKNFRINSKAVESGAWVSPGEEYGDLEVLVRGYTDQYKNAYQAQLRRAARGSGGDPVKLAVGVQRGVLLDNVNAHVLLDVRNLEDDDGRSIGIDEFRRMLANPDYAELFDAVLKAASLVGQIKDEDTKDDAGNSAAPSA